jgi:CheY-like chemotaxis protein
MGYTIRRINVAALLTRSCMINEYNGALTVLLVDDDEDLLHIIEKKLKVEGLHTILSLNGEKVREIITLSRPNLVLLDIHMQGIDGGDICRAIKDDPCTADIPVLLFSANDNIRTITEQCGADGYITKPPASKTFIDTIQYFLHKGHN